MAGHRRAATEKTFHAYNEHGGVVIIHIIREEWIQAALEADHVMVASDGMPYAPGAHPRSAGMFSRFLGRYVGDRVTVSLMDGLKKITLMPAQQIQAISSEAGRKGRVQFGADADVAVFDPDRILDTATFEDDLSYSVGVEHVLAARHVSTSNSRWCARRCCARRRSAASPVGTVRHPETTKLKPRCPRELQRVPLGNAFHISGPGQTETIDLTLRWRTG